MKHVENINLKDISPEEYRSIKLEDVLKLPYTAKNGITFQNPDLVSYLGRYYKDNCNGTIQLDNCVYTNNSYGLMIKATAYWTKMFGDTRGSNYVNINTLDTSEILEKLASQIEKSYKNYTKF